MNTASLTFHQIAFSWRLRDSEETRSEIGAFDLLNLDPRKLAHPKQLGATSYVLDMAGKTRVIDSSRQRASWKFAQFSGLGSNVAGLAGALHFQRREDVSVDLQRQ